MSDEKEPTIINQKHWVTTFHVLDLVLIVLGLGTLYLGFIMNFVWFNVVGMIITLTGVISFLKQGGFNKT